MKLHEELESMKEEIQSLQVVRNQFDDQINSLVKRFNIVMQMIGNDLDNMDQCERILKTVSLVTGIKYEKMISDDRKRPHVVARMIAAYLIRQRTELSLSTIGEMVRKPAMNHATVMHALRRVESDLELLEKRGIESDMLKMVQRANKMLDI